MALVALLFALYAAAFAPAHALLGDDAATLVLFPVLAAGWLLGTPGGLAGGVGGVALTTALFAAVGEPAWGVLSRNAVAALAGATLGGATGVLRDLLLRVRAQRATLEAERERLLALIAEKDRAERALQRAVVAVESARAAAVRMSEAKSRFLARASHELRTPLASLVGYAELLLDEAAAGGPRNLARDAGRIADGGRQLARLVDDLLDLSRIETGRLAVALADVDLAALLAAAADDVRPLAERAGNRLAVEVDGVPARIRTDPGRLRQILVNLLGNAAKFTRNGAIVLAARGERRDGAPWVVLEVRDQGIGMSVEEVARAFDEFWQARPSQGAGAGLGLSISRRLAELLGGTIHAESTPGEGSTFTVALPASGPGATP